jgi:putative flavoprotein involved in K+ transport
LSGTTLQFSGGLKNHCAMADLKQNRLLGAIDEYADSAGLTLAIGAKADLEPTRVPASPRLQVDLARGEFRSVVWATGFRPDYSYLKVPVFDPRGRLKHDGGVIAAPGLYALGLSFLRRRKSSFIHGAGDDARDLAGHLAAYLAGRETPLLEAV